MRLQRVRLFGFKTFADRTEFELGGDVTAVIGPNGCGKSNLVDAILWGLGEGNVKQLRAQHSQDVIFNGSAKRKAVGYAEVSLVFENEDGLLPVAASEVVITRRLTRAGDSEYSINGRTCRLRDIFDLLADSGLGRAGYAIVGQKDIDQALAASPDDRRAWVDEAAGVQRYRAKKSESLRKLATAQGHLQRIADIMAELETQREPLREEAEVALRYRSAYHALREVESTLIAKEVREANDVIAAAQMMWSKAQEAEQKELALATSYENQGKAKAASITVTAAALAEAREELRRAEDGIHRADTARQLAAQKLESLHSLEGSLFDGEGTAEERIALATAERDQARLEEEEELAAYEKLKSQAAGEGSEARALQQQLSEAEQLLSQARERQHARLRFEAENAHRNERVKALRREIKGVEESLPDLEEAVTEAQKALDAASLSLQSHQSHGEAIVNQLKDLNAEEESLAVQARARLSERATLEGRSRGILATLESNEGLQQGARAVMEALETGQLSGSYTPVGQAIAVQREFAVAIETALGGAVNDLIVNGPEEAKAAIQFLKAERRGRATFQPISLMRRFEVDRELEDMLSRGGVVGRAAELVDCAEHHRPVIESLLGQIVIVKDLDGALGLAKTRGWNRLVTLEGEVVHHRGGVTGGESGRPSYGLVQRKADLAAIEAELKRLEKEDVAFEKKLSGFDSRRTQLNGAIQAQKATESNLSSEVSEAKEWLRQVMGEQAETLRARQKLTDEMGRLAGDQVVPEEVDVAAIEARRDEVLKQFSARSANADQAEASIREAEARASQAQLRHHLADRRLQAAIEAEGARKRKMDNLEPEKKRASNEIEQAERVLAKGLRDRDVLEAKVADFETKRQELQDNLADLNERARLARFEAQRVLEQAHRAEIDRARAEAKKAANVARLLEEYGMGEAEALATDTSQLPADAATVVGRLRRELKAMGEVNLGAIDAFERLEARFTELDGQREDILAGIKEVQAAIRELDSLTRDKFMNVFEQVQVAFRETFHRIFEGDGEGEIRLSDTENVLESGVEIDVTLPGKRRQRLELLSGGERSLCAAAFLFALLKVKPSPLVVLDEVDAPLDGRNVERFITLLKDFSGSTQFLIITHNNVTIEATSNWLGVTMSEPGVSSLVPVRLPSEAKQAVMA